MTEDQLIEAMKTLAADMKVSIAAQPWTKSDVHDSYIKAMSAVIERYRKTNPYAEIPVSQITLVEGERIA